MLVKQVTGNTAASQLRCYSENSGYIIRILIWDIISDKSLGATARSYRRQDGADAAARFEKFLPAHASLRPPISLKFATE